MASVQTTKELYRNIEKNQKYHKIIVKGISAVYGIDLLIYSNPTTTKKGIIILVVIDYYTRYAGSWLIHDKKPKTILNAFKE